MSHTSDWMSNFKNVISKVELPVGSNFVMRGVKIFKIFENRTLENVL